MIINGATAAIAAAPAAVEVGTKAVELGVRTAYAAVQVFVLVFSGTFAYKLAKSC